MEQNQRFEMRGESSRTAREVVLRGWDREARREVTIRRLWLGVAGQRHAAAIAQRFERLSRSPHPNIVPVSDAWLEDEWFVTVSEPVAGCRLDRFLAARGAFDPLTAATLVGRIAEALVATHALGLAHGNIKPGSIVVAETGEMPRLLDFAVMTGTLAGTAGFPAEWIHWHGSPTYLAPEFVEQGRIDARGDLYACGLLLLELLTGRDYFAADVVDVANVAGSVEGILARIASGRIVLPANARIDPRLGALVLRACARAPEDRHASAAELSQALADWIAGDSRAEHASARDDRKATLEFLLRKMRHKSDFPALSDSVAAINQFTSSENESANSLAETILKDYALTNKILRLVNSVHYRQAGGGGISTVSRAVVVLGFDTIRNIAITVLLFEHLQDKANVREIKDGFLRANLAALLARSASRAPLLRRQGEEAFICALFHHLGQLLALYYFPEEAEEIRKQVDYKGLSPRTACLRTLGVTYEELGTGVSRSWGFPASIIASMEPLTGSPVRQPRTTNDALRVVSGFANELCDALQALPPAADVTEPIEKATRRFGASLHLDQATCLDIVTQSIEDLADIASILHLDIKQSPFARLLGPGADAEMASEAAGMFPREGRDSAGFAAILTAADPVHENAQAILAAGIQDISHSLVEDFALNDVLRIVLETIYRAIGFKHVLLALRDAKSGRMTGRFGLGPDFGELVKDFQFPLETGKSDVFLLATSRGLDMIIGDIDDPAIADKVPAWYRERIPAKTFVLFPLNIKGRAVALIYADKDGAGSITLSGHELTLLKTLRNQALLAIKQSA